MRPTLVSLVLFVLACTSPAEDPPGGILPEIAMAAPIGDPVVSGSRPEPSFPGEDINLTPSGGFGFGLFEGEEDRTVRLSNFVAPDLILRPARSDAGRNTEGYDAIAETGFTDPFRAPLSTFSIDVDTASMSNVRRILSEERRPPAGAVRIEEMLNYFTYDYPEPEAGEPLSISLEIAECPWQPRHRLVHVGIQGKRPAAGPVSPRNLVFLLDVSGSMDQPEKLPLVVSAMRLLVDGLTQNDHVGIVVYSDESRVVLEPTRGDGHQQILAALDRLAPEGSTNAGAGIRDAYALARRNLDPRGINRVILATDGDFNVGVTNRSELERLIEKERDDGIFLTVLGVGGGNLKDSRLSMLADQGNGNYAYLDSMAEARKVLVEEAGGTLETIAKDVKIQVEWNPLRVGSYRLIGYENRALSDADFANDRKDAGDIGTGHSVTALYEISPVSERPDRAVPLRYQSARAQRGFEFSEEILTLELRYKDPDGRASRVRRKSIRDPGNVSVAAATDDFRFASAVAAFGLVLRDSRFRGEANFGMVRELAHGAIGPDLRGHRRAFLDLVRKAESTPPKAETARIGR